MGPPTQSPFRALASPHDIRVLHLDAGRPSEPLKGWLEYTRLDNPPHYEALSYEWGSGVKTRSIALQDGSVLPITESLHDALLDLRQDAPVGEPRTVWADAICINQQNIEELQDQVSIMASIYGKAAQVVTYIGPERNNSTLAIAFARELQRHIGTWGDGSLAGENPDLGLTHPTLPPLSDCRWVALKALILRTWASRCWCAHEFLLNRRLVLMCGTTKIPDWYLISDIVQRVFNRSLPASLLPAAEEDPHSLRECLTSLNGLRSLILGWRYCKLTLHELLRRSHPFQATDPRDKVYSVLGLADDRQRLELAVDYTCTAERLYIITAAKIVQAKPTAEILYSCLHAKSLTLPSWVPDWSNWHFGSYGTTLSRGYNACGSTVDEVSVDGTRLRVAGCLVDEIVHVGEPIGPHYISLDRGVSQRKAWLLKEYVEISRQLAREPFPGDEVVVDTFWRTLIGNTTLYEETAGQDYQALYNALLEYDGEGSPAETTASAREFCDAVRRRSRYRRLAVTRMGYVGAVPVTAERDDRVCMLQGRSLLFAVRPHGPGFTYLGHAYIHGLMNGEVLQAEWYRKQTITLE